MDILDYLAIWRRRWKIVVAASLLGIGVAALISALTQPEYVASTRLFVTTTGGASVVEAYQGNLFGEERVQSYVRLATGKQVAQRTIDQLRINLTPDQLQSMVKAEVVPSSVLMDISVTNPNPTLAKDLANAVGLQTSQLIEELETSSRGGSPAATATLVDDADVPQRPATPKWIPNLLFGLLGGFVVGLAAAVVRDKLDRSVRSLSEAAAAASAPPMGSVPRSARQLKNGVPFGQAHPEESEAFRSLRTNLLAAADSNAIGAVVVAGPTASVGTASITLGLGAALAESGLSVIAVDANLRDRTLTAALDHGERVGLAEVLNHSDRLEAVVLPTETDNLSVLPAGQPVDNPNALLAGSGMIDVLKSLCGNFDYVLINGASILPYSDTLTLAEWADGVLLVSQSASTTASELAEASHVAEMARARIIGVTVS